MTYKHVLRPAGEIDIAVAAEIRRPWRQTWCARCTARGTTSGITGGQPVGVVLTPTLPAEQSRKTDPMERHGQVPVGEFHHGESRVLRRTTTLAVRGIKPNRTMDGALSFLAQTASDSWHRSARDWQRERSSQRRGRVVDHLGRRRVPRCAGDDGNELQEAWADAGS